MLFISLSRMEKICRTLRIKQRIVLTFILVSKTSSGKFEHVTLSVVAILVKKLSATFMLGLDSTLFWHC